MVFPSVSEYIAAQPREIRGVLRRVRKIIRKAVPDAEEGISYSIPAYKIDGQAVVYFAAWKNHYSMYPVSRTLIAGLKNVTVWYDVTKGTIRFPFSEPVPVKLIERIARFRAKEARRRTRTSARNRSK